MEEFFYSRNVSFKNIIWKKFFFRKLKWSWLIGDRTSFRPIRSVITLVIDKSHSSDFVRVWLQTELDETKSFTFITQSNSQ